MKVGEKLKVINKKIEIEKAKPFLKWAGGKTQLLEDLVNKKSVHLIRRNALR